MKKRLTIGLLCTLTVFAAFGQNRTIKFDADVVTKDQVTIKGQKVAYTATAGNQPVWDENGKAIASLFYVYYERTDVADRGTRHWLFLSTGGRELLPAGCTWATQAPNAC